MKQWILIQFLAGEISNNVCETRHTPRGYGLEKYASFRLGKN
jgi:hypothetical protein